jgi:hypothetical protein
MATANVIETDTQQDEKRRDDISRGYEELQEAVAKLQAAAEFWRATLEAPPMREWLQKQRATRAEERERWDYIKAGAFPESRALVKAITQVEGSLTDMASTSEAELRAKKQTLFSYWQMNEMLLKGAGYSFDVNAAKAELGEPEAERDPDEAPGETLTVPMIQIVFNQDPRDDKRFFKSLEAHGFQQTGEEFENKLHCAFVATDTPETRAWAEEVKARGSVLRVEYLEGEVEEE